MIQILAHATKDEITATKVRGYHRLPLCAYRLHWQVEFYPARI